MGDAAYVLEDLLKACAAAAEAAAGGQPASKWPVRLVWGAKEDAAQELGLPNEREALAFLGRLEATEFRAENLGVKLERPVFEPTLVLVDAYEFQCPPKVGYLAFFKNPRTGAWNIKSLKLNAKSPLTHSTFALLLTKRGSTDDNQ